jgi:hypothetical protein
MYLLDQQGNLQNLFTQSIHAAHQISSEQTLPHEEIPAHLHVMDPTGTFHWQLLDQQKKRPSLKEQK